MADKNEPFDFSKLEGEIKFDQDTPPKSQPVKVTTPAAKKAPAKAPGRPTKSATTTAAMQEMQEEIEGFLMLIGMPLALRDHHPDGSSCGDMFIAFNPESQILEITPEARNLAMAFAKVGVDNKYIKRFFELGGDTSKYIGLAMAVSPFVKGFTSNHMKPKGVRNVAGDSALV